MMAPVLIDTGPLVAFLNRRDHHHQWAITQMARITPPLLTCEAVLSEACFLVRTLRGGSVAVLDLLARGLVQVPFGLGEEIPHVKRLLARYANVPMSLADACLVRLSERYTGSMLLTCDSDFRIYRKHRRQIIPTLMPNDK
jgi:predicted nucleic acid-binding protein